MSIAGETYPVIATWIRDHGWIEIDDQETGGFVAKALDYSGTVFEGRNSRTLPEAMEALEQAIEEQLDQKDGITE